MDRVWHRRRIGLRVRDSVPAWGGAKARDFRGQNSECRIEQSDSLSAQSSAKGQRKARQARNSTIDFLTPRVPSGHRRSSLFLMENLAMSAMLSRSLRAGMAALVLTASLD